MDERLAVGLIAGTPDQYVAWLLPEEVATDDGRVMAADSVRWRDGRLPLMATDRNVNGHDNAVVVGNLVDFRRETGDDGTTWVVASVIWDSDEEAGQFRAMVDCDGADCVQMRGVSVDLAVVDADVRELDDGEDDVPEGWLPHVWMRVTEGVIVGATLVPMPAFADARVEPVAVTAAATDWTDLPLSARDMTWDSDAARRRVLSDPPDWDRFERAHFWVDRAAAEERGEPAAVDFKLPFADMIDGELTAVWAGVTAATAAMRGGRGGVDIPPGDVDGVRAHQCRYYMKARELYGDETIVCPHDEEGSLAAAGFPVRPPAHHLSHDGIDGPTALTVTDDGRVFGHLALAGTCHVGHSGCVTMPEGADLTRFLTGLLVDEDGGEHPVGQIVLAGGHPDDWDAYGRLRSIQAVTRAYADTRSAVADVTAGVDEWGTWVSGSLRPSVTDEAVRVLRASPLSGHWRWESGVPYLIAAVAVNSQGFPVPRLVASAVIRDGAEVTARTVGPAPEPLAASAVVEAPSGTDELWEAVAELRATVAELTRDRARSRLEASLATLLA